MSSIEYLSGEDPESVEISPQVSSIEATSTSPQASSIEDTTSPQKSFIEDRTGEVTETPESVTNSQLVTPSTIKDLTGEDPESVTTSPQVESYIEDLTGDEPEETNPTTKSEDEAHPEQKISSSKEDTATTPISKDSNGKTKYATMGLYVPPSLRATQLNVHAKEFVMGSWSSKTKRNDDKQEITSKMSTKSEKPYALNTSKSSLTVFDLTKSNSSQFKSNDSLRNTLKELSCPKKKFGDSILSENNTNGIADSKIRFNTPFSAKGDHKISEKMSPNKKSPPSSDVQTSMGNLKRSKSLNAADALRLLTLENNLTNYSKSFTEYDLFPEELHSLIQEAANYPDRIRDKKKIVLGRTLVELAIDDKKLACPVAKLSVIVINKDNTGAYLDSVLNTSQMYFQLRNKNVLHDPRKLAAFLVFLQELYCELKFSKLQLKLLTESTTPPKSTFLLLIARCCNDILRHDEMHSVIEVECVFQALVTIGRDIEIEIPNMFGKLFEVIKRVLLRGENGREIQKLLLQLLELRAAKWQLPISALNYYYPKVVSA